LPKAKLPISIGDVHLFALDDTGSTKSYVDLSYLSDKVKKTITPWEKKAVFSAGFVSFIPCGIVKLTFNFGKFKFILPNVGVLEKNTVP